MKLHMRKINDIDVDETGKSDGRLLVLALAMPITSRYTRYFATTRERYAVIRWQDSIHCSIGSVCVRAVSGAAELADAAVDHGAWSLHDAGH